MGDMESSKMPTAKTIKRKDKPQDVRVYSEGNWIKDAVKKPGALRTQLGVKGEKKIPAKTLAKATKVPGKLGQRARLAQTFAKMRKK
jgi:hypothetical protein